MQHLVIGIKIMMPNKMSKILYTPGCIQQITIKSLLLAQTKQNNHEKK